MKQILLMLIVAFGFCIVAESADAGPFKFLKRKAGSSVRGVCKGGSCSSGACR